MNQTHRKRIAIIGNGPAGLAAASHLAMAGFKVDLFDQNPGVGRKLLIAGSSGLNIGHNDDIDNFCKIIKHDGKLHDFKLLFQDYFTAQWLDFIHHQLKQKTFLGTSGRYFIEEMNSAKFIQSWIQLLEQNGVMFFKNRKLLDFELQADKKIKLALSYQDSTSTTDAYDAVGLYLGGGSWVEEALLWPQLLNSKGYLVLPFVSANTGFHLKGLDAAFYTESKYKPIKDCILKTSLGEKHGDLLVTNYGLEGTPIYHVGIVGEAYVDFFPHKSSEELLQVLNKIGEKENLMIFRRVNIVPGLCPAAKSLIYHSLKNQKNISVEEMSKYFKNFPIYLSQARPLKEAISSDGGVSMDNLLTNYMSKLHPGLFFGGEMLNWTAPTGGYLIQTCVSQGFVSARGIESYLLEKS